MAEVLGTTVLHEVAGGISTITLNRPEVANALHPDQRNAIIDLLASAGTDRSIRAVQLRANGKFFCTGADVSTLRSGGGQQPIVLDGMRRIMNGAQRLVAAVLDCPKPVVATVQGPAAGLGAQLVFACDLVVASDTAYFLEPFLQRGLVVDAGGAYLLPRLIGLQRAKELAFLGDRIPAAQAHAMGLVNRVSTPGDLQRTADELLERLAKLPTTALSLTKQLFNTSFETDRAGSFVQEAMAQELQGRSDDIAEGLTAFAERRDPIYKGH